MDKGIRAIGLVISGLGLGIGAYMALIVAGDGIARYTLTGTGAQEFVRVACSQVQGCRNLAIEAGYDWRNGNRRVIYRLQMSHTGSDQAMLARLLPELAYKQNGVLGWTLRVPSALIVSADRASAGAGTRKTGR